MFGLLDEMDHVILTFYKIKRENLGSFLQLNLDVEREMT